MNLTHQPLAGSEFFVPTRGACDIKEKAKILDNSSMEKTLERIAHEIVEHFTSIDEIAIIGIKSRGAYLGERLADKLEQIAGKRPLVGALDITLYRDDLTEVSEQPIVHATEIDFDIDGMRIILVDDVLFTGRTIRCALDALIDFGRPSQIQLAVLVDRGHRELPIRADYVGKNVPTSLKESVEVRLKETDGVDEVVICERNLGDEALYGAEDSLDKKDLLGLEYLSREEIEVILYTASSFKEVTTREIKKVPALRGKTVVNLFYEPSTRTRTSFELAAKRLSADVINIATESSSVKKGETLIDTGRNIEALKIDIIVVRHDCSGAPNILARAVRSSVVNAGDGWHEHPTQALLDMFTLKEKLGRIEGLKVSIIGDIAHSRVARSNIWGLTKLGAKVTVCAPPMLIPEGIERMGVKATSDLDEAIRDADAINVLRMQFERDSAMAFPSKLEYYKQYGITTERLRQCKKDIVVMHPGPINRGVEMSSDVADGKNSVILEQVTNGIAVRMAVLYLVAYAQKASAA